MKKKLSVNSLAVAFLLLMIPVTSQAGVCGPFREVVPDGRVSGPESVDSTSDLLVTFRVVPGRSYSVEVVQTDFFNNIGLTVGPVNDTCPTTNVSGLVHTESHDPVLDFSSARRGSFVAGGAGTPFHVARISMSSGTHPVTYSVSETTINSPAWSTNGTFDTFYSLQNTTRSTVNVTITLLSLAGSTVDTGTASIAAGGTFSTNTSASGLATPRSQSGVMRITHDGPPGAILCEASIASFAISPPFLQPVKCAAMREAAH